MPAWVAIGSSTSATCTASSRVGTSTRPSGLRGSATSVMRASIGTPKASVLPEPVLARPHTSRPCMATGTASVWIANGWANPHAARPVSIRSGTPSAANPVGASTGGRALIVVRLPERSGSLDRARESTEAESRRWPPPRRLLRRRPGGRGVASFMVGPGYRPDRRPLRYRDRQCRGRASRGALVIHVELSSACPEIVVGTIAGMSCGRGRPTSRLSTMTNRGLLLLM